MHNTNSVKWSGIYTNCQKWRDESWRLQGLLPPTVPEENEQEQDNNIRLSAQMVVRRIQAQTSQFLYERDKKRKRPVLVLSKGGTEQEDFSQEEDKDYRQYTMSGIRFPGGENS